MLSSLTVLAVGAMLVRDVERVTANLEELRSEKERYQYDNRVQIRRLKWLIPGIILGIVVLGACLIGVYFQGAENNTPETIAELYLVWCIGLILSLASLRAYLMSILKVVAADEEAIRQRVNRGTKSKA